MYDTFLLKNQKINNKDMYILITDLEKIHKLQKDKIEQLSEKPMNIEDNNFIKTFIRIIEEYIPVKNLRYIDRILTEWHSKGIQTESDIKKEREKHTKKPKKEVFDYDWLNEND